MAFFRVEVTHQTFTITAHFEDMWRNKYLKMKPYKGQITVWKSSGKCILHFH